MYSIHLESTHSKHIFDVNALKSCYHKFCKSCLQKQRNLHSTSRDKIQQNWTSRTLQYVTAVTEPSGTIAHSFGDGLNRDKVELEDNRCDCELEANGNVKREEICDDDFLGTPCRKNCNMIDLPVLPTKTGVPDLLAGLETTVRAIDDWSSECQDYDAFDEYVGDCVIKMDPEDTIEFSRGLRTFLALGLEER